MIFNQILKQNGNYTTKSKGEPIIDDNKLKYVEHEYNELQEQYTEKTAKVDHLKSRYEDLETRCIGEKNKKLKH